LASCEEINFEAMKTAIVYGSAMASFCVEEFSLGKIKTLNKEMIDERLSQFKLITEFSI